MDSLKTGIFMGYQTVRSSSYNKSHSKRVAPQLTQVINSLIWYLYTPIVFLSVYPQHYSL